MSAARATSNPERGLQAEYAAQTDRGLRRRRNEDAVLVDAQARVAMVADGVGGLLYGDQASQLAVDALHRYVAHPPYTFCDELLVGAGIISANRSVYDWGMEQSHTGGMSATTLVALHVSTHERSVTVGHVGDSRCYRIRDGQLTLLTCDHTLENEIIAIGAEPLSSHLGRNLLVRSVGRSTDVEPEVHVHDCIPGDVFLLCSDGLWALVSDEDMQAIVAGSDSLDDACARLIVAANAAGGSDNISVAMVRLTSPTARTSEVRRKVDLATTAPDDDGLELDWMR